MDDDLIREALILFPESGRPAHFTDRDHCDECREHDDTLLAHTRETISFDQLGYPGWDPICFVNEAGFKYYFPAMVRLALGGTGETYYLDQFLFHITQNTRCNNFNEAQAAFVLKFLEYLLENRSDEIDDQLDGDDLLNAMVHWNW